MSRWQKTIIEQFHMFETIEKLKVTALKNKGTV